MRKRNFTSLEVLAEQVRKAELQIFASQGRAEAREQNFTYLAVKAERKCGSGTSHFLTVDAERMCGRGTSDLWQSRQSGNAEAEHQVFGSQGRAEVQSSTLTVQSGWTCGSRSLTGPYPIDCHCQCGRITLLTAILKDNVKTMCG